MRFNAENSCASKVPPRSGGWNRQISEKAREAADLYINYLRRKVDLGYDRRLIPAVRAPARDRQQRLVRLERFPTGSRP
jgi:hypothetical protein